MSKNTPDDYAIETTKRLIADFEFLMYSMPKNIVNRICSKILICILLFYNVKKKALSCIHGGLIAANTKKKNCFFKLKILFYWPKSAMRDSTLKINVLFSKHTVCSSSVV